MKTKKQYWIVQQELLPGIPASVYSSICGFGGGGQYVTVLMMSSSEAQLSDGGLE